ncbi:MAG TPA: hypothetical protein VEY71_07690 [Chitinophagales bacterium]|nr:hypothetical protein [Chitinophagales bacterium]
MAKRKSNNAQVPNPALEPLKKLIGNWKAVGTHPLVPDTILHGHSSFKWIEGGAFMIWRSEIDFKRFPSGVAIFGSDDETGEYFMLYFDERKVSRKYKVTIKKNTLKWQRNALKFSQRCTWIFDDNGNTIVGKGELSEDGNTWKADLDMTYTRVKVKRTKNPEQHS